MVHYALIYYTYDPKIWRYQIVAPTADVIDEWWRVVSANSALDYKRLAPDFYTYTKGWPYESAPELKDKIAFWQLSDRDTPSIPYAIEQQRQLRANVVSGGSYFIRSKSDPSVYWYGDKAGSVYAYRKGRTRFHIILSGEENSKEGASGKVIIQEDRLLISSALNPKLFLSTEGSEMNLGEKQVYIKYHSFKYHFLAQIGSFDTGVKIKRTNEADEASGIGERWELVE